MKKGITTLFLGLAVALGAQAQEYNLFYDVDEDGWLWFDSQEKIDKYVGTCDEDNYCVNPDGKPIQLIYADYQPDYPSATADPTFVGAGAEGELGAEGARTGALIIPGASSFAGTNGGGFVVLMPSCASYDICMSCEGQARPRIMKSFDANTDFNTYTSIKSYPLIPLFNSGIYTWNGVAEEYTGGDETLRLKSDVPVYAAIRNMNDETPIYIHGIRVTTPTNSTLSVRDVAAKQQNRIFFEGNRVVLNEPADIRVYSADGLLMNAATHADRMDLSNMPKGIYIVKAGDATRKLAVQ